MEEIRNWSIEEVENVFVNNGLAECGNAIRFNHVNGERLLKANEVNLLIWKRSLNPSVVPRFWALVEDIQNSPTRFVSEPNSYMAMDRRRMPLNQPQKPAMSLPRNESTMQGNKFLPERPPLAPPADRKPQFLPKNPRYPPETPQIPQRPTFSAHHDEAPHEPQTNLREERKKPPLPIPSSKPSLPNAQKNWIKLPLTVQDEPKLPIPSSSIGNTKKLSPVNNLTDNHVNATFDINRFKFPHYPEQVSEQDGGYETPEQDTDSFDDSDDEQREKDLEQERYHRPLPAIPPEDQEPSSPEPFVIPQQKPSKKIDFSPSPLQFKMELSKQLFPKKELPTPPVNKIELPVHQFSKLDLSTLPAAKLKKSLPVPNVSDFDNHMQNSNNNNIPSMGPNLIMAQQAMQQKLVADNILKSQWYWRDADRKRARTMLEPLGNGAFAVRPSRKTEFYCTLTVFYNKRMYNIPIKKKMEDTFILGTAEDTQFKSVQDLIDYYLMNPLQLFGNNGEFHSVLLETKLTSNIY